MSLTRFKLGTRLGFGYAATLALMVVIAALGISSMSAVNENLDQVVNQGYKALMVANEIASHTNSIQISVRNIVVIQDKSYQEKEKVVLDNARGALAKSMEKMNSMVNTKEARQAFEDAKQAIGAGRESNGKALEYGLQGKITEAAAMLLQADAQYKNVLVKMDAMINQQSKATAQITDMSKQEYNSSRILMISLSTAALVIGAIIAFFLTRSITKPISRVVDGLTQGAEQIASASSQVSSASQSLAEGASEQAASIEETSSSLEEISSMTRQNAQAANDANRIMAETSGVVTVAAESMNRLTESMVEISRASEETQKIIKTIDEIAFQTNLLALNAAVEAARAGEAGAGFAVVADEVRNLAMRAADAAKNTANLIEGTVKKIKDGSDVVSKTNEEFTKVSTSSMRMRELVSEIAAASQEQAQGIEQINKGVSMMDKVVQHNASSAEESASASQEMNAQAEQMKDYVDELVAVIEGAGKAVVNTAGTARKQPGRHAVAGKQERHPDKSNGKRGKEMKKTPAMPLTETREVGPDRLLPEGKEDFESF